MAQAASLSLRALAEASPTPTTPAAIESPAAPAPLPVEPPIAAATVQPPIPIVPPAADDDAEPSAEVMAALGDPGKRALQAERDKRKAATAKLTELQAELARLQQANAAPANPPVVPPPGAAVTSGQPATPPATAPSVAVPTELARCETFEQVDACRANAADLAATAMELNTVLVTTGLEAAQAKLKANGVETFRGVPVDQLTPEQLAAGLSDTWKAATQTQALADRQKAIIHGQRNSFAQAVNLIPGLKDPKSVQSQNFDALVAAMPQVRQLGPQWPLLVAQQMLGIEAARARSNPPVPNAAPVLTPVTAAAPMASAPSAPRTSAAVIAQPTELDALRDRVNTGKATMKDMERYASLQIR